MGLDVLHPSRVLLNGPIPGALAAGVVLATTNAVTVHVPLAGAARWRHRFETTEAGTLAYAYCAPAQAGETPASYGSQNPANVAVSANTETGTDEEHFGEDYVAITFTPSTAPCTVTRNDMATL